MRWGIDETRLAEITRVYNFFFTSESGLKIAITKHYIKRLTFF